MRTTLALLIGLTLGISGTAAATADKDTKRLPIHCDTYTDRVHSCTVKDTGDPYKIRLRYMLNGERFFIDSITSTCPLSLDDQSHCRRLDVFTGPRD